MQLFPSAKVHHPIRQTNDIWTHKIIVDSATCDRIVSEFWNYSNKINDFISYTDRPTTDIIFPVLNTFDFIYAVSYFLSTFFYPNKLVDKLVYISTLYQTTKNTNLAHWSHIHLKILSYRMAQKWKNKKNMKRMCNEWIRRSFL